MRGSVFNRILFEAAPWFIMVSSPLVASIQLAHGSGYVDLASWLILAIAIIHFRYRFNERWGLGALISLIGLALASLGRVGLVFNYFILTNGIYQLIMTNSWGPWPLSMAFAFVMTTGLEMYGIGAVLRSTTGEVTVKDVLINITGLLSRYLTKNGYVVSFLVPFLVRMTPEIASWPWFVGYDTPEYAATLMDLLIKPTFFTYTRWYGGPNILPPLLFMLLYPIAHVVSPWIIFKFADAVLLGLISVSMNFMLRRMGFDEARSLLASLLATLYPTMYTLSWEFAMLMMGLVVFLLAMGVMWMHISQGRERWLALLALTILSALAHQVSATLTTLVYFTYFILRDRDPRWLGLASIGIVADLFYTNFTMITITHTPMGLTLSSSLIVTSPIVGTYLPLEQYLTQLLIVYWPFLALMGRGRLKGNFIIYSLLAWLLIILLPSALTPSISIVSGFWWIWALLLPIALAPLSVGDRRLALVAIVLFTMLDVAWTWSSLVDYIFPTIGPQTMLVQGAFTRACLIPGEEKLAYEAGLYVVSHPNATYVTDYCLYTFIHLADRFGSHVIPSYTPLETAEELNGTVYLITLQYHGNLTLVRQIGEGVTLLPYGEGVVEPIYIYRVKP